MGLRFVQLLLLRVLTAWALVILTVNFVRISIIELKALAVLVTTLMALPAFLSPVQVYFGQLSDRLSLWGLRRTPFIALSALGIAVIFPMLPSIGIALGQPTFLSVALAALVFLLFAICSAMHQSTSNALIIETIPEGQRERLVPVVNAVFATVFGVVAAVVSGALMPTYTPEGMQNLYNLSSVVVVVSTALALIGLEKRNQTGDSSSAMAPPPPVNIGALLRANPWAQRFLAFLMLAYLAVFMQNTLIELFGGEVFAMTPQQTALMQAPLGTAALLAMVVLGGLGMARDFSKRTGTYVSLGLVTLAMLLFVVSALTRVEALIVPALFVLGFGGGILQFCIFAMMPQMTLEGRLGLFVGIWGSAAIFGGAVANMIAGGLHTALVEPKFLEMHLAYALIFLINVLLLGAAIWALGRVSAPVAEVTSGESQVLSGQQVPIGH